MRLIDADELLTKLSNNSWDIDEWELSHDQVSAGLMANAMDRDTVNAMPTVDAIPIGWIEEQIRESYDASKEYDGCYDYAWDLSELVKRWREKNGTVD